MELPKQIYNSENKIRTVGFELEFSGLNLEGTADALVTLLNGKLHRTGEFTADIESTRGLFHVEFDSSLFKEKRYEKYLRAFGLTNLFTKVSEVIVPFEVVTPPLPITDMNIVEDIREALRLRSAKGATSAPFRAFGLQFNPEVPDKTAATLVSYLKAFFVLFDWVYDQSHIPLSRKLAPFIHNFPSAYIRLVTDSKYCPDLNTFMLDYLKYNPTRNRPLDLLPLFADINKDLVFSFPVEKHKVKPRPTFHYRLPNSEVNDPQWTISKEWHRWVEIENLANDKGRLIVICEEFRRFHHPYKIFARRAWIERTREYLHA